MKRSMAWAVACVVMALPADALIPTRVVSEESPPRVVKKWEYKIVARDVDDLSARKPQQDEELLNKLGDEGWELGGLLGPTTNHGVRFVHLIFKRPKP